MAYKLNKEYLFSDFNIIWHTLHNELVDLKKGDLNLVEKRNYVKSFVSYAESILYLLRDIILNKYRDKLTIDEILILSPKKYSLKENGKVNETENHHRTTDLLLFIFNLLNKLEGNNHEHIDKIGFNFFKKTVVIRNKIVHIKSKNDLIVHDTEIEIVKKADKWFYQNLLNLLQKSGLLIKIEN